MARKVGVLALQGDFAEHVKSLETIGAEPAEVRLPNDLADIDALIIPGGESTTIVRLMDAFGLAKAIKGRIKDGMPAWGTCAGMIVLASSLVEDRPQPLGLMDIRVQRNAYGRQIDSFETEIPVPALGGERFRAVFIRAPAIEEIGPAVEPLACLEDGQVVAAREGSVLVTAFHPELTADTRFHSYFLGMGAGE